MFGEQKSWASGGAGGGEQGAIEHPPLHQDPLADMTPPHQKKKDIESVQLPPYPNKCRGAKTYGQNKSAKSLKGKEAKTRTMHLLRRVITFTSLLLFEL